MKWSSAVSESFSLGDAVAECASKIGNELGALLPDMVIAFVSAHHESGFEAVPGLVRDHLGSCVFIGCSGGGVIGEGREVEHRPGFAMSAAMLPDVELTPFHIEDSDLPDPDAAPNAWEALVHTSAEKGPQFLLMADPFSLRGERLLMGLDYAFPQSVKIGGLASGAQQPGGNALYLAEEMYRTGAVGLAMSGDIVLDTVVAQGCRPIGEPTHVTSCDGNVLLELNGRSPFDVLKDIFERSNERDRELAKHSLFLGIVMDELKEGPEMGDFLIRNIVGVDPRRGALAVGEMLKEGQTVQFHIRDADTSVEELNAMLTRFVMSHPLHEDGGALMFSCLGRGSNLYGRADQDTDVFREKVGRLPLTGFFCNGEVGPVGGSTYLHGYTSSFGIFRPARSE